MLSPETAEVVLESIAEAGLAGTLLSTVSMVTMFTVVEGVNRISKNRI